MKILKKLLKKINPRDTRININAFHHFQAFMNGQEYLVKNISISGIALFVPGSETSFQKGDELFLDLIINNTKLTVRVITIYRSSVYTGFKVLGSQEKYKTSILGYFESELESISVKKMDSTRLADKYTSRGNCNWYFGDSNHELVTISKEGVLVYYQLKYYEYLIESDRGELNFSVCEEENFDFTGHKQANLVRPAISKLNQELINILSRFVQFIPDLELEVKNKITEDLSTFPRR